jgi:hypothetical protein
MLRRLLFVTLAAMAAALWFIPVPAASADDGTNLRNATLSITLGTITGGTHVCGNGTAHYPGSWTLAVNGFRSDGTQITGTSASPPAVTFHGCLDVLKNGSASGYFYVTLIFFGGSTNEGTDRPGAAHGVVAWVPGQPDFHFAGGDGRMGISPRHLT